jgi:phosphoserine aminotransferase
MYIGTARRWIAELQDEGKLSGLDSDALETLANDYARRLEEIYLEEVTRQMEKYGKAEEFERMLLYDGQYMNKYLNQTIPGYPAFRMEIFSKARKIILGDAS